MEGFIGDGRVFAVEVAERVVVGCEMVAVLKWQQGERTILKFELTSDWLEFGRL